MIEKKYKNMPDFCNRDHPFHYATALNLLSSIGVDVNNIYIKAVGVYENYKGEILKQEPKPGTRLHSDTKITLEVGYPSAVDYMPYQFFYGLGSVRESTGQWEDSARDLMAPFDASVIRHDSLARFHLLKYDLAVIDPTHLVNILKLFKFDLDDGRQDIEEILYWLTMFPTFHFWSGSAELVPKVLEHLLGYRVTIKENIPQNNIIPESIRYYLGDESGRLGKETTLGREFTEYDSTYEVIIDDIPPEKVREFLPGQPKRKKIEWFLNTAMPGDLEYRIKIKAKKTKAKLSEKEGAYLGYSSFA